MGTEGQGGGGLVPKELEGREVSVRALLPPWDAALRAGASAEVLASGTGYSIKHLRSSRERISWAAFARILGRIGEVLDDDELIRVGMSVLESSVVRAIFLPGRLLMSLGEVYRWGGRPDGPFEQTFHAHDCRATELAADTIRFELKMRDGYAPAREHWLITQGALRGVSHAYGVGYADVEVSMDDSLCEAKFVVRVPQEKKKTNLLQRVRKSTSWLFAARDAAEELRRAHEELNTRYRELQREVEARKGAEADLRELNEQLEKRVAARTDELAKANRELAAANHELTTFNTSAAHDLRSPLRAINGFATALLEDHGDRLDDDAKLQVNRVIAGSVRMATLIDALLALSRVSRSEVRREQVDLSELAYGVIEQLQTVEPQRAVEIAIAPNLRVEGDPALLRSVMQNLLGNAWKFTRDRRPARIELLSQSGEVEVLCVRDNGVGFDMRHAQKLFDPFCRLHAHGDFEGTGIGLATVDRIVRRHGGRIWADANPNEGATFSFTLTP